MSIAIALSIEADGWTAVRDPEALLQRGLDAAERIAGVPLRADPEVSILLCDDAEIRSLNASWRGKDAATNVLSFPVAAPKVLAHRPLLGDIAIAWETTAAEAAAEGKTVSDHLAHLAIHGFLHLIGFDHEAEAEAEAMESLERRILAALGIADPYAAASLEHTGP